MPTEAKRSERASSAQSAGARRLPAFERATVADVMHPGLITCEPEAPLRMVAATMASERVHCVLVEKGGTMEPTQQQWSVLSDLDLISAVTEDRFDRRTARSAAISEFLTVTPEEKLHRAAQMMTEHQLTHLVVIDGASERPIGVVSTLDTAGVLAWGDG